MTTATKQKPRRARELADDAAGVLAQLEARLADAERTALSFKPKRDALAFAVETGDAAARTALDELCAEETANQRAIDQLRAAVGELNRRYGAAHDVAVADLDAARLAAAIELGRELIELDEEIDADFADLPGKLKRREVLVDRILTSGTVPPHAQFGFGGPARLNSAVRFARLQGLYTDLQGASSVGDQSLAAADRATVLQLTLPSAVRRQRPLF